MTHYLNSTRLQRLAGIITEEQASYLSYQHSQAGRLDRQDTAKNQQAHEERMADVKRIDQAVDQRRGEERREELRQAPGKKDTADKEAVLLKTSNAIALIKKLEDDTRSYKSLSENPMTEKLLATISVPGCKLPNKYGAVKASDILLSLEPDIFNGNELKDENGQPLMWAAGMEKLKTALYDYTVAK